MSDRARDLRPFFGFYGGKWRDTPSHFPVPAFGTIVEPFAGSAGYSVRYPDRRVILCEIDPVIAAVWRYLTTATPDEVLAIPDLGPGQTVDDLELCPGARGLVGFWLNRGASRPRRAPSSWMRSGIRPGSFWGSRVKETIAAQLPRIAHWEIHEGCYTTLPDLGTATWFLDPPYQRAGKHYHYGSDRIDFPALAGWARSRPGQVIVCENEGADWLPFTQAGTVKTTRRGATSAEVVWLNAA